MRRLACFATFLALGIAAGHTGKAGAPDFFLGADLSYVNEMQDCGAVYRDGGQVVDPYVLFAAKGANIVRLRLWHSADWTEYSDVDDVIRASRRAKAAGMQVLLNLHYSDDWADPGDQIVPAAWADIRDTGLLGKAVRDYTVGVLLELHRNGVLPDMVQVGNETNTEILVTLPVTEDTPIDWRRNAALLNAGLAGVLDAGRQTGRTPATMLHIAQPENVEPWFDDAIAAGVADFDLIGISYYPKWSSRDMHGLGKTVRRVRHKYGKEVIVVETAYPWTLQGNDAAGNLLGEDALIEAYPATLAGQNGFLQDLAQTVMSHGGSGVVYWEPAWVSSECSTRWGQGSHWENSTFFDYKDTSAHTGFDFLSHDYKLPVTVRFIANFAKASTDAPVYLWASFFDGQDFVVKMEQRAGEYVYPATLPAGHAFEYRYFAEPAMQVPLSAIEHATVSVPEVRETTGALRMDIRTALGVR